MRILITGGSGFVCLNIAQKLLMEGNDVFIYDKASLPSPAFEEFSQLNGKLTILQADVMDRDCLENAVTKNRITHIIHGAAVTPSTEQERDDPQRIIQINFGGTLNVLDCLKTHPDIRLIYISSMAAVGRGLLTAPSVREAELSFYPTSCYGIAKFASEQMIQEYSRLYSIRAVSVRLGAVFGPWEHPNASRGVMSPALRIIQSIRTHAEVTFNRFSSEEWIYSRDVANYVYELLKLDRYRHSSYCLVSGSPWTTQSFCKRVLTDYPGHSYRLCNVGEATDICFLHASDNAVIREPFIFEELSYRPLYNLDRAYADYSVWLKEHPDFI